MTIAYRAGSTAGNASGGNLTVNKPAGTVDGDILVAVLYREAGAWTLPSGWVQWGSDQRDYGNQMYLTVAWKRAASEGASWTFNLSTTTWRAIAVGAFSGALASGDPIDVGPTGNNADTRTPVAASITTATDNAMRIVAHGNYEGLAVAVGTSGMTRGANIGGTEIWYVLQAAAGASGAKTFATFSGGLNGRWATFHLAIKPAATGTTGTLSVTLGTATAAAGGALALAATLARTLDAATSSAVGKLAGTGTLTATLGDATVSAAGAGVQPLSGSLNATLAAATLGATGVLPIVGTAAGTLAAATLSGSGALAGTGTLSQTLAALTVSAVGGGGATSDKNYNVQVGDGYTDVSPKQLVRTSGNVLYTVAPNCDTYPDFSSNGLTQTIRVNKANSTGVPTGFTRQDSSNEPTAVVSCAAAIDGSDIIHIVWEARSSSTNTRYLRYAAFSTVTDTWGSVTTIASDLDYDDIGQGDQNIAIALDSDGVPHIVYLSGSSRRIYYRNRIGGTWSAATQVDSSVSYTGNQKAWHPNIAFDPSGRILVVWARGGFNGDGDTTIYSRVYSGSWGSTVQASSETDLETGIDQSTSVLITADGTYHLTYILHNATHSLKYIRYRYSTDQGATWTANNPSSQATHNPVLGWTGSKLRIMGHGTPDVSNHGQNLYYFEGDGGAGAWGSWTQFVAGTNYDSSINARWAQFFDNYPFTLDVAYWNDNYPNVLYAGTEVFTAPSGTGTLSVTLGAVTSSAVGALAVKATVSVTLDAATINASGTLAIVGTLASTLQPATLAAAAILPVVGTLAKALDAATLSAASAVAIKATAAVALDTVSLAATGALLGVGAGSLSIALGAATLAAAAKLPIAGTLAQTLETSTLEAAGTMPPVTTGALGVGLSDAAMVATGALAIVAAVSITAQDLSLEASGRHDGFGALVSTLADSMVVAIGVEVVIIAIVTGAVFGVRETGTIVGTKVSGTIAGATATGSVRG